MTGNFSRYPFSDDGEFGVRHLTPDDVAEPYLAWLHDAEVTKYLSVRHAPPTTLDELRRWVASFDGKSSIIWGVFDSKEHRHIGTITVYAIDRHNHRAHMGFMVGDQNYWGRNVVPKSVPGVLDFVFGELDLRKISVNSDIRNLGSIIVFKKLGFSKERHFKDHVFDGGEWFDDVGFAMLKDDWLSRRSEG